MTQILKAMASFLFEVHPVEEYIRGEKVKALGAAGIGR